MQFDYEIIDLRDQKFEQLYTVVQRSWHRCMLLLKFIIITKRNASVYNYNTVKAYESILIGVWRAFFHLEDLA